MTNTWLSMGAPLGLCGLLLGACLGGGDDGGGGDSMTFEGCGDDNDCKGERICVDSQCVDPDADPTTSGSGDSTTDGSSGASGDDKSGDGDTGGSTQEPVLDDPELEAACIADCEARLDAGCEMLTISLDQCTGSCLIVDEINDGYCHDEQRAQYNCLAAGGYTCINGYPQPQSTCIEQSQALSQCHQERPCRHFCDEAEGKECAPEGDCFEACQAEWQGLENAICNYDYQRLISCWSQGLTCNGARRSIESCEREVADVADCIGLRQSECEGYCWAAEILGCAPADCVESCTTKVDDPSCGWQYRRMIECSYDRSYDGFFLTCDGDAPTLTEECASEVAEYDACIAPPAP